MKKLMILGLTICLTVILAACSGEEQKPSKENLEKSSYKLVYYEVLNNGD
ncbi:hypothetical protein [Staphylococcus phage vB_StaM_PB50]|nr:hypothetical protein [Staphylococcus phage vB_StaM_PB50]